MKIKRLFALFLCVLMAGSMSSCAKTGYEASFTGVFDTYVQVYATAKNRIEFSRVVNEGMDMLNEYHRLYDIYNDYDGINNIKTINDSAGKSPVKVDERIIDLLKFCKESFYLTGGSVNVAMGSVLELWHDARISVQENVYAQIPSADELSAAAEHTDIESIEIDEENSTVFITDENCRIDVGAVAKGYATQKVADFFVENGLTSGFVSVGGNVSVLGKPEDGSAGWKIGIQDPDQTKTEPVNILSVPSGSLSTSGDYQRYFVSGGVKYHHIIHKDTLFPAEGLRSVSVWTTDSGMADVLSTYFFTVSMQEAMDFIENNPSLDIKACWIDEDGNITYTDSMKGYLLK